MQLTIKVDYRHPSGKAVTEHAAITLADYAAWERRTGKVVQQLQAGMGINDLLFLAWHRLTKAAKENRAFELWTESVDQIEVEGLEAANPTEPAASDAS
jgi:hypothetical protein